MIVCVCNNVSTSTIERLYLENVPVESIVEQTKATTCCGCCENFFVSFIRDLSDKNKNKG